MWRNYYTIPFIRYTIIVVVGLMAFMLLAYTVVAVSNNHLNVDLENEYGRRVVVTEVKCMAIDDRLSCRGIGYNEYADATWSIRTSTLGINAYPLYKGDVLYYICDKKDNYCRMVSNFQKNKVLERNPGFEFK